MKKTKDYLEKRYGPTYKDYVATPMLPKQMSPEELQKLYDLMKSEEYSMLTGTQKARVKVETPADKLKKILEAKI